VHALIGIGEGLITAAALSFILASRPDLLPARLTGTLAGTRSALSRGGILGGGLALAAILALLSPDGLERIAEDTGFLDRALDPFYNLLPDYTIPGLDGSLSTILAGLVGVLIIVALGYGIAAALRRRRGTLDESGAA
jgi:cobalt/nickel transport system permease protein